MKNYTCRVCGENKTKQIYSEDPCSIVKCLSCQFATLSPLPSVKELKEIYSDNYFDDKKTSDFIEHSKRKLDYITKKIPFKATLLDYGCGTGDFIKGVLEKGYGVSGYDISSYAADYTKREYGVEVLSKKPNKKLFEKGSFDAIASFDVIEHIVDFKEILGYFNYWLKDGGLLFMTTPDVQSWDAKLMGKKWYGFNKIPDHVNYFSKKSMILVLKEKGFEVEEIKVWGFTRSIQFILENGLSDTFFRKVLLKIVGLTSFQFYVPAVDMMVVARKSDL